MKRFTFTQKTFLISALAAVMLSTLWISGCGKREKQEVVSYPLEVAQMVSQVTSGIVSANDLILVRFTAPMADESQISSDPTKPKKLPGKLFKFDPKIKGEAFWQDAQTLVFKPAGPLETRKSYHGNLDLSKLFPNHGKTPPLPLQFSVAGREILSSSGDFELINDNNPLLLVYKGQLEFSESVPLEALRNASRLSVNSAKSGLSWEADASGRRFRFKSAVIQRDANEKVLQLKISKSGLDLSGDFSKDAFLPPLSEMEVTECSVQTSDRGAAIVVAFSDELDANRDAGERIGITPSVASLKASSLGREIRLSGDFDFGGTYTVRVMKGLRSRWGTVLKSDFEQTLHIEDIKPRVRFTDEGVFVPSVNERKIRFETVNVRRVRLNIMKVFESNLSQFLQTERLGGRNASDEYGYEDGYGSNEMDRVGVTAANDTLVIGDKRNAWLQHELDLKNLLKKESKGLYLIRLSFERRDMMYKNLNASPDPNDPKYYSGDPEDPGSYYYLTNHGRIEKPVVFSDIGLTCKQAIKKDGRNILVFATDLRDAAPMSGVAVTLRTYQNQVAGRSETDGRGVAEISSVPGDVFFVEAEKKGQKSAVKLNEMGWNLSGFDTGGENVEPDGLRAFLYTERGVYRPGDNVHLCCIARNADGTFPDGHPVTLKVFNPKNQVAFQETRRDGKDGFYHFQFRTNPDDPTGNWLAKLWIGSRTFERQLKIETVAPYTLKLDLKSGREQLGPADRTCMLSLNAKYLFGVPASGLQAGVEVLFRKKAGSYPAFPGFSFDNAGIDYRPTTQTVFSGPLNDRGNTRIDWVLPRMEDAPSAFEAVISARVIEKGGRPNLTGLAIPVDPFERYVGLKLFDGTDWVRVAASVKIPVILASTAGRPVAGRILYYRIYQNRQHWWWEFESQSNYRIRFKSDKETRLVKQGVLTSAETPAVLSYSPDARGQYFLEVQDGKDGHTAGMFFSAYEWGEVPSGGEGADLLTLNSDKKEYHPGERAAVRFPAPKSGSILVTVEKGGEVLSYEWADPPKSGDWKSVSIPVTDKMIPNVYVTVSVIQPHSQTLNDRPIRMYGVLPIFVTDPRTRQDISIIAPDAFEPEKKCSVEVRTGDGKPTRFTLAVVDEGLLDITRFTTPDPWKAFHKKERLAVNTYDLFSLVAGANKGDVFRTFSIGGGLEEEYRESQLGAEKTRRFKPVVVFKGPIQTDKKGRAKVEFDMPNYVGSVRIMAVSARGKTYGSAEKAVPVKSDLMVMPSLPRALGPNDKVVLPVTVFAMEKGIGQVEVSVEAKGPVSVSGDSKKTVAFEDKGEKDLRFELLARHAVGTATVTVKATSSRRTAQSATEIAVRSSSPRIYETRTAELKPGGRAMLDVPGKGLEGTNRATLTVWRRRPMRLGQRLWWLLQYPYGCIEQTVSAAFPQLYLKTVLETGAINPQEVDWNINAAVARLSKFQLASGAFTYWPGEREAAVWATDYAGRFIVEAKKLGYSVPEDLFRKWMSFEKNLAHAHKEQAFLQAHRLYLLALAGEPQIGAMNVLREDSLKVMSNAAKWLLAGAYQVAGAEKTAQEILGTAGTQTEDAKRCHYWQYTYGTGLRDRAIILEMAVLFERWPEANLIMDEFTRLLASDDWFSTQTLGQMLIAAGKFIKNNEGDKPPLISGTIRLPDGSRKKFKTEQFNYAVDIPNGFGKTAEVELDASSTVNRVFCELEWNGVPLEPDLSEISKNLNLSVEWLNDDGKPIDPVRLKQGTVFWGHFTVGRTAPSRIDNMALVQVLPSGWEIENIRLSGEDLPAWVTAMHLNRFDYQDLRDDRVMWFFDFEPYQTSSADFLVKLNAVTAGEYTLPPTLCEAMYDANYQARKGGRKVVVE